MKVECSAVSQLNILERFGKTSDCLLTLCTYQTLESECGECGTTQSINPCYHKLGVIINLVWLHRSGAQKSVVRIISVHSVRGHFQQELSPTYTDIFKNKMCILSIHNPI